MTVRICVTVQDGFLKMALLPAATSRASSICYDDLNWGRARRWTFLAAKTLKQRVRHRLDMDHDLGHLDRIQDAA